jgi:O-antigen/teichoic acid export membrane protein
VAGAFWVTAGTVLSRVGALLAWIPVARLVGEQVFGEIGLLQSTIALCGVVAGDALGVTAMKFVAEHRDTDPRRAGRILMLSGLIAGCTSLLVAGAIVAGSGWLASQTFQAPHLAFPLQVTGLAIFFTALNGAQSGALAGLEAFRDVAVNNVITALVSVPILILGAWQAGVHGVAWGLVSVPLCTWLLNHRAVRQHMARRGIPRAFAGCLQEWRVLVSFSLPAVLAGMVGPPIYWAANTILVRQPNGYAELGVFCAANQWRAAVLYLTGILASLTLPILANLRGSGELHRYQSVFLVNLALVFGASVATVVPLLLLAPSIMGWYGPQFTDGWPVLISLLLVAVLMSVQGALWQLLSSSGRMWQAFVASSVWGVVLLIGAWHWRDRGAAGLAQAHLVSFAVYTAVTALYAWRGLRQIRAGADLSRPDPAARAALSAIGEKCDPPAERVPGPGVGSAVSAGGMNL